MEENKIQSRGLKYYYDNKERILNDKSKKKYCPCCDKDIRIDHFKRHTRTIKHIKKLPKLDEIISLYDVMIEHEKGNDIIIATLKKLQNLFISKKNELINRDDAAGD